MAALPRCAKAAGPNEERCKRLLLMKTLIALRLGSVERVRDDQAAIDEFVEDRASPTLQADAMFVSLRRESFLGPSSRQHALFERVQAFATSGSEVPVNPVLKTRAMLTLAESCLLQNNPGEAQH